MLSAEITIVPYVAGWKRSISAEPAGERTARAPALLQHVQPQALSRPVGPVLPGPLGKQVDTSPPPSPRPNYFTLW
jgi:hypothetical protein